MPEKKKILLFSNRAFTFYKFRIHLIKQLLEEGFQVILIGNKENQKYSNELESLGVKYYSLNFHGRGINLINEIILLCKILSFYRELKPDIAIHFTIKPNLYGGLVSRILSIPTISMITGLGTVFINKKIIVMKIVKFLYRSSLKKAKYIWFTNLADKSYFLKNNIIDGQKTTIIPGAGVDTKHFFMSKNNQPNEKFTFLFLGRLHREKGIFEYLEASKILKRKFSNKFQSHIVGFLNDTYSENITYDKLSPYVEANIVSFFGHCDDVRNHINDADCVVVPSYREGLSTILIEAASMGKPLIATDVPGCREVVNNNINGYLCNEKNINDLAEKMEMMMLTDKKNVVSMSANSRKIAEENFDKDLIVKKQMEIISKIVNT